MIILIITTKREGRTPEGPWIKKALGGGWTWTSLPCALHFTLPNETIKPGTIV